MDRKKNDYISRRTFSSMMRDVFGNSEKVITYIYMDGFRWISHYALDARTRMVKQSVHLLPRSMIYFEDFLSSCISRATRFSTHCAWVATGIFFSCAGQNARREIFSYTAMHQFEDATLEGEGGGVGVSGADTREKIKDLSSVNGLLFDSIRSEIFVRRIQRVACVSLLFICRDCILSNNNIIVMLDHFIHIICFEWVIVYSIFCLPSFSPYKYYIIPWIQLEGELCSDNLDVKICKNIDRAARRDTLLS